MDIEPNVTECTDIRANDGRVDSGDSFFNTVAELRKVLAEINRPIEVSDDDEETTR